MRLCGELATPSAIYPWFACNSSRRTRASARTLSARDKPVAGIVGHVHRHGVHARRNENRLYQTRRGNISASVAAALFRLHKQSYGNPPRRNEAITLPPRCSGIKRKSSFCTTEFMKSVYFLPRQAAFGAEGNVYAAEKGAPRPQTVFSFPSVIIVVVSNCHSPFRFIQLSRINCGFGCSVRNITVSLPLCFCTFLLSRQSERLRHLPSFAMAKLRFSVAEDHRRADPVTAAARPR